MIELHTTPYDNPVRTFLTLITDFALVLTLVGTLGFKLAQLNLQNGFLTTSLMLAVLILAAVLVLIAGVGVICSKCARRFGPLALPRNRGNLWLLRRCLPLATGSPPRAAKSSRATLRRARRESNSQLVV